MIPNFLKNKLATYSIEFTSHVQIRLLQRQISREILIKHLRECAHLKVLEQQSGGKDEEKYKLWFVPHKRIAYVYVVAIKDVAKKIIVITAIKQRLSWQRKVQGHDK